MLILLQTAMSRGGHVAPVAPEFANMNLWLQMDEDGVDRVDSHYGATFTQSATTGIVTEGDGVVGANFDALQIMTAPDRNGYSVIVPWTVCISFKITDLLSQACAIVGRGAGSEFSWRLRKGGSSAYELIWRDAAGDVQTLTLSNAPTPVEGERTCIVFGYSEDGKIWAEVATESDPTFSRDEVVAASLPFNPHPYFQIGDLSGEFYGVVHRVMMCLSEIDSTQRDWWWNGGSLRNYDDARHAALPAQPACPISIVSTTEDFGSTLTPEVYYWCNVYELPADLATLYSATHGWFRSPDHAEEADDYNGGVFFGVSNGADELPASWEQIVPSDSIDDDGGNDAETPFPVFYAAGGPHDLYFHATRSTLGVTDAQASFRWSSDTFGAGDFTKHGMVQTPTGTENHRGYFKAMKLGDGTWFAVHLVTSVGTQNGPPGLYGYSTSPDGVTWTRVADKYFGGADRRTDYPGWICESPSFVTINGDLYVISRDANHLATYDQDSKYITIQPVTLDGDGLPTVLAGPVWRIRQYAGPFATINYLQDVQAFPASVEATVDLAAEDEILLFAYRGFRGQASGNPVQLDLIRCEVN